MKLFYYRAADGCFVVSDLTRRELLDYNYHCTSSVRHQSSLPLQRKYYSRVCHFISRYGLQVITDHLEARDLAPGCIFVLKPDLNLTHTRTRYYYRYAFRAGKNQIVAVQRSFDDPDYRGDFITLNPLSYVYPIY